MVELLVAILIISILAGLILGVASVAGETARAATTRNIITRLHTLLMEHYDTYKTRRVRLASGVEAAINDRFPANSPGRGRALAEARLYALREMMLMEIPDRWSDIALTDPETGRAPAIRPPVYLDAVGTSNGRTALANMFLRRYVSIANPPSSLRQPPTVDELTSNQGAECLYLIITLATADGEARSQFHESDIGDTDGDGAPEFLDGWGQPINFLRWAPGFDSQIQLNANLLEDLSPEDQKLAMSKDHDPFDVFRAETNAYRLVPLIYSGGRDESYGVFVVTGHVTWLDQTNRNITLNGFPALTPYAKVDDPDLNVDVFLGTILDTGEATDNIHNHLLGRR
jgi:type II secretory pathway pseudopilin PulG